MADYNTTFNRYEKKYLLSSHQYESLRETIEPYVHGDKYGDSVICSLYFDTPDFRLIRASMQAPTYKEKLRLRCYGVPADETTAFVELKKKYKSVVYKRRINMPYLQAYSCLCENAKLPNDTQIAKEIGYMREYYGGLIPAMAVSCERIALYENFNDDLRLTFDSNILWRSDNLDLRNSPSGTPIIGEGERLLEIKTTGAMPLWLAKALCNNKIYPTSFSKYAKGFGAMLNSPQKKEELFGGIICA